MPSGESAEILRSLHDVTGAYRFHHLSTGVDVKWWEESSPRIFFTSPINSVWIYSLLMFEYCAMV